MAPQPRSERYTKVSEDPSSILSRETKPEQSQVESFGTASDITQELDLHQLNMKAYWYDNQAVSQVIPIYKPCMTGRRATSVKTTTLAELLAQAFFPTLTFSIIIAPI